jgi:hypothetical protein
MSASASREEAVVSGRVDRAGSGEESTLRLFRVEAALAVLAFAALCAVVLAVGAPQKGVEPDDGAYHLSIVAVTMGDFLTLSSAQLDAVETRVGDRPGLPNQWIQLADGRYISEKDPGYPYLAAPFEALGIMPWSQLFYGALACLGLFIGARRWLGRFGGLAAVGLYCSSGAALIFAWRMYMPTFTDASLVAAGSGALLWAVLATEASARRRTWAGLAGFAAIEIATFVRYTDIVILGCAVAAVILAWWLGATKLPRRAIFWWLASVLVFAAGVAVFDDQIYGGPLTTGYQPGEVAFSLGAIGPNLRLMPGHLIRAMPMLAFGLVALAWIIVRRLAARGGGDQERAVASRDLWVGLTIAASWFAIWGVYAAYTWTTDPTAFTLSVIRFYVPAIGAISLLGAWLVTRIPGRAWVIGLTSTAVIAVLFVLGVWSFHGMWLWAVS